MNILISKLKQRPYSSSNCPKGANKLHRRSRIAMSILASLLLVFATGFFALSGAVLTAKPALAAGVAGKTMAPTSETDAVLTYEEAVELALKSSTELKNAREGVLQAEEMREMLANMRLISGFTPIGLGYDQADAADRELLLQFTAADTGLRMAGKQIQIIEEMIAFQVRCAYDEVLQNTAGLEKTNQALALEVEKLIQTEAKTRLGVESLFNRENARLGYAAGKEQRDKLARQLDEAYIGLNKILGLKPGARPKLQEPTAPLSWLEEQPSPSTKAGEAGLERHLATVLHDHPYIWLQEQQLAQAERELSLYTYNVGAPSYKAVKSGVQQEKNDLYILKDGVREGVRSLYYQLQGLESQHKALEKSLALAENGLRAVQVRYKLGMAIPLEVKEAELAASEIKSGMQDLARAYNQLKMLYEKPWLMPASL